jgi:predicted dinucleotide-binding enzyme
MRIGVIGAGGLGGTLARQLAKLGRKLSMANSRGPGSLTALAAEIGATRVSAFEVTKAADMVIVSIPTMAVTDPPRSLLANMHDSNNSPKEDTAHAPKHSPRLGRPAAA